MMIWSMLVQCKGVEDQVTIADLNKHGHTELVARDAVAKESKACFGNCTSSTQIQGVALIGAFFFFSNKWPFLLREMVLFRCLVASFGACTHSIQKPRKTCFLK